MLEPFHKLMLRLNLKKLLTLKCEERNASKSFFKERGQLHGDSEILSPGFALNSSAALP
jgi:hypothetical protein